MIERPAGLVAASLLVVGLTQALGCGVGDIEGESHPHPRATSNAVGQTLEQALTFCAVDQDCASDEACTQGGHCVNVTGERSATAALQADLDALAPAVGLGVPYDLPPNALLRLDDPDGDGVALRITGRVIFNGRGSLLRVDNGVTALEVGPRCDWGSVRDLSIEPVSPNVDHDGIGVDIHAHGVRLDNLYFHRMGTGIKAHSRSTEPITNLNVQQWNRLVFIRNYRYAMDLDGRDVNAGLISGVEIKGGNGIRDSSFLGNTYVAPMINGTTTDSITLDSGASTNLVLGAYLEFVSPNPTSLSMHDLHVGGNGIDRLVGPGDRIGRHAAYLRFKYPNTDMQVRIPGAAHATFGMKHPQENEWWYLRYFQHPSYYKWGFSYRNGATRVYSWTSSEHPDGVALYEAGTPLYPDNSNGNGNGNGNGDEFDSDVGVGDDTGNGDGNGEADVGLGDDTGTDTGGGGGRGNGPPWTR